MKTISITTLINFCTYDFRLLQACIEGVRPFSNRILISVCDHFFDGSEENYALLEHAYHLFPDCCFIEYAFDPEKSYRRFTPYYPDHPHWRHEWHNAGRWIGYYFLPDACDAILFLDTDEIIDGERFCQWLHHNEMEPSSAVRFSAYWYFREARYQAETYDHISLLVKREALCPQYLWHSDERAGILACMKGEKKQNTFGLDQKPLVHHYSWVRTKEELRKKFTTWGHHWERSWSDLLEAEYAAPFQGKDFIRGYTYRTLEPPRFDPLTVAVPHLPHVSWEQHLKNLERFPHVQRVDIATMQRKELSEFLCL